MVPSAVRWDCCQRHSFVRRDRRPSVRRARTRTRSVSRSLAPPRTLSWIDCHKNHDDSVLETFRLSIAALLWSRSCCNYCCCFCCCCCWIVVIPNKLFLGFLVGTSKKSLNEFPLMQNPFMKWNGLVGWFVCLFHNEEIQWPPLFVSQCENLLQNKTLKYKIGSTIFLLHRVFLVFCPVLVLVLVWVWVLVLLQRWSCLWDAECCEEDTRVVSWVTSTAVKKKTKSQDSIECRWWRLENFFCNRHWTALILWVFFLIFFLEISRVSWDRENLQELLLSRNLLYVNWWSYMYPESKSSRSSCKVEGIWRIWRRNHSEIPTVVVCTSELVALEY